MLRWLAAVRPAGEVAAMPSSFAARLHGVLVRIEETEAAEATVAAKSGRQREIRGRPAGLVR
jgi:hypothetical protein